MRDSALWWYNYRWRPNTSPNREEQLQFEFEYATLGKSSAVSEAKVAGSPDQHSDLPPLECYE